MGMFDPPTMTASVPLLVQSCISCGIPFAFPQELDRRLRETRENFYCPNGHKQHYTGQTDAERLAAELAATKRAAAAEKSVLERQVRDARADEELERKARKHFEHKARGMKGALNRVKKRVAAGRCPCCSHEFKDLERHMKNQHPKWDPEQHAAALAAAQEPAGATIDLAPHHGDAPHG